MNITRLVHRQSVRVYPLHDTATPAQVRHLRKQRTLAVLRLGSRYLLARQNFVARKDAA